MNSTVSIYVNNIACYGPQYICKCKRHDKVRYECITNRLFGTLATERICLVRFVYDHNGSFDTHWPPSTFAKFSLFVTDQSKSAQLVIRFVGRFMSSLSRDLQSTML